MDMLEIVDIYKQGANSPKLYERSNQLFTNLYNDQNHIVINIIQQFLFLSTSEINTISCFLLEYARIKIQLQLCNSKTINIHQIKISTTSKLICRDTINMLQWIKSKIIIKLASISFRTFGFFAKNIGFFGSSSKVQLYFFHFFKNKKIFF